MAFEQRWILGLGLLAASAVAKAVGRAAVTVAAPGPIACPGRR